MRNRNDHVHDDGTPISRRAMVPGIAGLGATLALGATLFGRPARAVPGQSTVINVRDVGAVGDGATDDRAAFQLALDTSHNVYVPPGKYRIAGTLRVWSDQAMWGAAFFRDVGHAAPVGAASILLFDGVADASGAAITQADGSSATHHFGFRDLGILVNGDYLWAMKFRTANELMMTGVGIEVASPGTGGVLLELINPGADVSWTHNWVACKIRLPAGSASRTLDAMITDSLFTNCNFSRGGGVILRRPGGNGFSNCIIQLSSGYGATLVRMGREDRGTTRFIGCEFDNNTVGGILVNGDSAVAYEENTFAPVILGNIFRPTGVGSNGIVFQNNGGPVLQGGVVIGNVFTGDNMQEAVVLDDSRWRSVVVTGNYVEDM